MARTIVEEASKKLISPELAELSYRGHYTQNLGSITYLSWSEASQIENQRWFEKRFSTIETVSYNLSMSMPNFNYLESNWSMEDFFELQNEHQLLLKENNNEISLFARRDALETQLRRNGERIKEPLNKILSILKVWAVETEHVILKDRDEDLSTVEIEEIVQLKRDTQNLWQQIKHGFKSEYLVNHWMPKILYKFGTPPALADAQKYGIEFFLEERDTIIEESLPLYRKWWAHEIIIKALLAGEDVKASIAKDIDERISDGEKRKMFMDREARSRMQYVFELKHGGWKWKEIQDHVEQECERLEIPCPYSGEESLRNACKNFMNRNR